MPAIVSAAHIDPDMPVVQVTYDDGTVWNVPDDMANRHRIELQDWIDNEGGEVKAYEVPPAEKPAPTIEERLAALEAKAR